MSGLLFEKSEFNSTLLLIDKYSVSCSRKNVYLEDASLAK